MPDPSHPPIGEADGKAEAVESMFDAVAPRYDLLNRVLSAGIDRYWLPRAVRALRAEQPRRWLDAATDPVPLPPKAQRPLHHRETLRPDLAAHLLRRGRPTVQPAALPPPTRP